MVHSSGSMHRLRRLAILGKFRAAVALLLIASSVTAGSATDEDDEVIHVGMMLPLFHPNVAAEYMTAIAQLDYELGKYEDPPKREFLRPDGSRIPPYVPITNPHPNVTRIQFHVRDSGGTRQTAGEEAVAFASGATPMNIVIGPLIDGPALSSASILGVLRVVQISMAGTDELTNKAPYPYLWRYGFGNSQFGRAMWDYLEFFGWRGGHMLYEDDTAGNEIREGMLARAEARRRSGDVQYFRFPEITAVDIAAAPDGLQDVIIAAETAAAKVAKDLLTSFHRLIFFAFSNTDVTESIVKTRLLEERVTEPNFQILVGPAAALYYSTQARLEGHRLLTFQTLTVKSNFLDPTLWGHRESWLALTTADVMSRLPYYGLDLSKYPFINADTIAASLAVWPPLWAMLIFGFQSSLDTTFRAFNAMLHAGYKPNEMRGDALMEYLQNVTWCGYGGCLEWTEDRDVKAVITISCGTGFDAANNTIWLDAAIRRHTAINLPAVVEPIEGVSGLIWATGNTSWFPPTSLVACPPGSRFIPSDGSSVSDASPSDDSSSDGAGSFARVPYGTCERCPAGQFSDAYDSPDCKQCPGGTISAEGSSECTICPIGSFALGGSAICTECFAGSFGETEGASSCGSCTQGRFQNITGQTSCEDCPPGTYAVSLRAEECFQCRPGTMAARPRSATCDDCSPGFFQDSFGALECLPCRRGSFAEESGAAVCSQCRPGYYQPNASSPHSCDRCPAGSFSANSGTSSCEDCTFGTTLLLGAESSALCTCPTNTFLYVNGEEAVKSCVHCNEYVEPCAGGEAPAIQKSGYHVTADGQSVYQCMSKDACPGGLLGSCPTGSAGPGCAECEDGSYYWDGNSCAKCNAGSAIYVIIFPLLVVVILLGTHRFGNDPIGRQSMSAISEGIVLAGLMLSAIFFFSSFEALDVQWKEPVATIMDLSRIFSTELLNMNFSCSVTMSSSASMALTSAIPLMLMLAILPFVALKWASPKLVFNTFGSIVYSIYLLVILHGLTPFRYIVHPMADKKSILVMPNIFEDSDEHYRLIVVGVGVLLVYCAPFAALCGWASVAVMRKQPAAKRRSLLKMFRFLFYKFKPQSFYWGFYILMRNAVVGLTPSLFPERPSISLFLLSALIVQSAISTATVWPWRARWMNYADSGTLAYLILVLNLATGWVRSDEDSDGAMATVLVVAAAVVAFVAAVFALRLIGTVLLGGAAARAKMRASAQAEEEALENDLMAFLSQSSPELEIADGFDSLMKDASKEPHLTGQPAIAPALTWVSTQPFDIKHVASIAAQIRKRDYSLQFFYEDCMSAFPELKLYEATDGLSPDRMTRIPSNKTKDSLDSSMSVSGRTGEAEQMRTIGALFAIYWICRLDMDGKQGMSFGVEEGNTHRVRSPFADVRKDELQGLPWGKMTSEQKRVDFFHNFNWSLMVEVFANAGILQEANNGRLSLDDGPGGSLVALLCLTSFHDIMKCSALCPQVVGDSYHGYSVGETIQDHDIALSYILDRHPNLLPSFKALSEKQKHSVRFTQSDMGFNAGWLVQAEGPPSTVMGKLKKAITSGMGSDTDVAFYFAHFLTDLAGAEPTPFRGAEKFAAKFPPKVLQGLLGCVGTVKRLAQESETQVYERYLEKRWHEVSDQLGPLPTGMGRTVKLRLNCMAQHAAKPVLDALDRLSLDDLHLLICELSETGVPGQLFSEFMHGPGSSPEPRGPGLAGPPFLTYYGPAWCQRAGASHPDLCLRVLVEALRLARETFDFSLTKEPSFRADQSNAPSPKHYTIQLAALRTIDLDDLQDIVKDGSINMGVLQVTQVNSLECNLILCITSA